MPALTWSMTENMHQLVRTLQVLFRMYNVFGKHCKEVYNYMHLLDNAYGNVHVYVFITFQERKQCTVHVLTLCRWHFFLNLFFK